jgi:hypothetical protein
MQRTFFKGQHRTLSGSVKRDKEWSLSGELPTSRCKFGCGCNCLLPLDQVRLCGIAAITVEIPLVASWLRAKQPSIAEKCRNPGIKEVNGS